MTLVSRRRSNRKIQRSRPRRFAPRETAPLFVISDLGKKENKRNVNAVLEVPDENRHASEKCYQKHWFVFGDVWAWLQDIGEKARIAKDQG